MALNPGSLWICIFKKTGVTAPYTDTAGKFVPEKNFVDIAFGAGADLVASKGWVKIADGSYKYVITLKDNANKLLDNTADLVIDKITASIYGNSNVNTWKYASDDGYRYVASAEESVVYMLLTAAKNQGASAFSKVALTSAQVWLSKFDVGYVPNVWHMNEKIAKTTIVDMNNVTEGKMAARFVTTLVCSIRMARKFCRKATPWMVRP